MTEHTVRRPVERRPTHPGELIAEALRDDLRIPIADAARRLSVSQRLKQLEAEGIVLRRTSRDGHGWTYHLSEAGEEFVPIVMALGIWGQRWSRRELAEHEQDLGLLLWAIERGAHPECLGDGRTVVELELTDQPEAKRRWSPERERTLRALPETA